MKTSSVFDGNELKPKPPALSPAGSRCSLIGKDEAGGELRVPLSEEILSKHLLFLGGIGAGKTNAIFQIMKQLRQNMTSNDVMLVFDTKGDYYNLFYHPGDIVIANDDKATGPSGGDYWNIFNEIEMDAAMEENIYEIAHSLFFEKTQRSSQPFFPNAARDLFSGILLHYARSADRSQANNASLRAFLNQASAPEIRQILQKHEDLKAMVSYIGDDRSPQTQGVVSELQQLMREIFIGNFCKPGSLSMRQAIRSKGGKVIFVEYDLGYGATLAPIYRLLLDMAIKEALCRQKSEGNVWFIIDEFRLIPNLKHVDDGVNFGRSLGAKFIIGVQNVEQVFYSYGESLARSILSGFMTTVAFRVNDITTRSFIQQLFGKNRKKDTYSASVAARGLIEEVREGNVVEDWDIANLRLGEAIVGLPNLDPFQFKFSHYI